MRALLIAAVAALLSASPAEAASLFTTTSRVQGAVTERFGPELDSFALDSDTVGRPDLSGSAEDPGGTATSEADVDLQTATVVGGERLSAQGTTSARSGLPVRESDSTSGVVAEFFLTKAATYQAGGTLSGSNAAGQCCRGSSARLTDEDGNKLFESVVSQGQADKSFTSSGTLPPASTGSRSRRPPGSGSAPRRPTPPGRRRSTSATRSRPPAPTRTATRSRTPGRRTVWTSTATARSTSTSPAWAPTRATRTCSSSSTSCRRTASTRRRRR